MIYSALAWSAGVALALAVRPQHRQAFAGLMRESFRLRRRSLVERPGWTQPGDDGEIESAAFGRGGARRQQGMIQAIPPARPEGRPTPRAGLPLSINHFA